MIKEKTYLLDNGIFRATETTMLKKHAVSLLYFPLTIEKWIEIVKLHKSHEVISLFNTNIPLSQRGSGLDLSKFID